MMLEKKATEFLEMLSSKSPVPGGGGASAAVGALGAALGLMVTNLTIGKKKYAADEGEMIEARQNLSVLQDRLVQLVDQDAEAFEPLSRAYSLPKNTEEEKTEKDRIMEEALYTASIIPIKIMETVLEVMHLLSILGEKGSTLAVSDVGAGILFAQAALEGASLNVFINTKLMKDVKQAQKLKDKTSAVIAQGRMIKDKVYAEVLGKIQ